MAEPHSPKSEGTSVSEEDSVLGAIAPLFGAQSHEEDPDDSPLPIVLEHEHARKMHVVVEVRDKSGRMIHSRWVHMACGKMVQVRQAPLGAQRTSSLTPL